MIETCHQQAVFLLMLSICLCGCTKNKQCPQAMQTITVDQSDPAVVAETKLLQGYWRGTVTWHNETGKQKCSVGVEILGNSMFWDSGDYDRDKRAENLMRLNPLVSIHEIDELPFVAKFDTYEFTVHRGIYRVHGDILDIAIGRGPKDARPTSKMIDSNGSNKVAVFRLHRVGDHNDAEHCWHKNAEEKGSGKASGTR